MNLVSLLRPRSSVLAAPKKSVSGGGYGTTNPLGAAFTDRWRKDRPPTPLELITELVGIAYVCADLNASTVAGIKLQLFVRTRKGERKTRWATRKISTKTKKWMESQKSTSNMVVGGEVEEVLDHPILKLLDVNDQDLSVDDSDYSDTRPNFSGFNLMKMTQMYLESIGRAYWLIEFDGLGVPQKVWLLRSMFVKEVFDPEGSGRIIFYEYGGPSGVKYNPRQILRFVCPDPYNPYIGSYSPLMAAMEKLRIYRGQDASINALLENSARPEAIWSPSANGETGGMIGPAEARRMEVALNQKFREAGRGSILVQPYPGTMQVLGWRPGDVVELERSKLLRDDILAIFGIPDAMFQRNQTTVAGAKTSDFAHAKYAVVPRLTNILSTLRSLLRMYDPDGRMFFSFVSPLPEDSVMALEQTRVGVTTGAVTVDEFRVALDLEPFGDEAGKTRYINNQLMPIGRDGQVIPIGLPPTATPAQVLAATDKPPKGPPDKSVRSRLKAAGYADEEIVSLVAKQCDIKQESAQL